MNDHVANIRALLREAAPIVQPATRKSHLRLVPKPHTFDSITRESHLQRIRYLGRAYRLRWLIDQATFDKPAGLDSLEDAELVALHQDMDKAMDCLRDGIAFDEAGLLRAQSEDW